jgi:ribulose 1,5-bisphosphate synthetase/thiazole synthase
MQTIVQPGQNVTVIAEAEVAVIGGSFAGIASALEFVRTGKRVIIIEPRTYLGRELTATLRPWLPSSDERGGEYLPDWIKQCLDECTVDDIGGRGQETPLHPDRLKIALEDIVSNHGIRLLYASLPVGFLGQNDRVEGLIIANKSGRQVVLCDTVIDATETAIASSLAGENVSPRREQAIYYRTLEFDGVDPLEETTIPVPGSLGLFGDKVTIRQGIRGDAHRYVEFALRLHAANTLEADKAREIEGRVKGMSLASYLVQQIPAFGKANLGASSYELCGPYFADASGGQGADALRAPAKAETTLSVDDMRTALPNVWSFYREMFRNGNGDWLDAIEASKLGGEAARIIIESELITPLAEISERRDIALNPTEHLGGSDPLYDYDIRIPSHIAGRNGNERMVPLTAYPVLKSVDVLVAGGGSSGASASIFGAREGVSTMLIDANPGMGGTGTFGGVDSYWFGRRVGYAAKITEAVNEVQDAIGYKGHKWNIEAKMHALLNEAVKSGTHTLFNAITFGAVTVDNRVCGSIIATRWGPFSVLSKVLIDATGDGDIAAFAGAKYVYGSETDLTVMWYSLAQFREPGKSKNNFTSMVNMTDIEDLTRALLTGRRRGDSCHDHSIYVATRESRHIEGDVTMTLPDQLLHRRWEDTINIHFSNHDVKGVSGADWVSVGLIPPNLEIEIPYSMLLPKGLDGMLVAGKAISATHDALPAIRMQADLENLGGVVALAAAYSVKAGKEPRDMDILSLQERLVDEGLLPSTIPGRKLRPIVYSDDQLEELVKRIEEQPLYEYSNMRMNQVFTETIPFVEICSVGPRMIPVLERALIEATGARKIRIAQALAMYESSSGVSVLAEAIMDALKSGELPKRTAEIMYVTLPPDHGAMPDAAYLLYSLAQTKNPRSIPVWRRVADLVHPTEEDFKDVYLGLYYYVDAVCKGAERLGDPEAIPELLKLHAVPYLRNQQLIGIGIQPDFFLERRSMLELAIGRALARCGHPKGYEILIAYLDDARSLLKHHAHLELCRLSGETFTPDQGQWAQWLDQEMGNLVPSPQQLRLDVQWNSESIPRQEIHTGG